MQETTNYFVKPLLNCLSELLTKMEIIAPWKFETFTLGIQWETLLWGCRKILQTT